jgi:hypothetical protein
MMASEEVRKIGFTGSTAVGKTLMAQAANVRRGRGAAQLCQTRPELATGRGSRMLHRHAGPRGQNGAARVAGTGFD